MKILKRNLLVASVTILVYAAAFGQTPAPNQPAAPPPQNQTSMLKDAPANSVTAAPEVLAIEIVSLRKSVQTLSKRLGEFGDKFIANANSQNKLLLDIEVLNRTEQRAEVLRRQLFEIIEKETQIKTRIVQNEENLRPEAIERSTNIAGTTRVIELRDARRRILETDRENLRALLVQIQQSRARLEFDVQEADSLVARMRRAIFPIIEREIEKLERPKQQ